jgi:hypothetical protein
MYPHPSGFTLADIDDKEPVWWGSWITKRKNPRQNILFCDGHVAPYAAKTWPNGDQIFDADRIKHMRFGMAGQSIYDPY